MWDRTYGTVAYVTDRIQARVDQGTPRPMAIMDTLAAIDADLYVKVLKEAMHCAAPSEFDTFLIKWYSSAKCVSFK